MEIKVSGSVFVSLELLYRSIGVGWGYFFFCFGEVIVLCMFFIMGF